MANGNRRMEVTRTPDRLAGAEGLSRELANVMNFALQRRFQQERQQQALDAVRAEQAAEDERLDRKLRGDFANLQAKMAQDALQFKEQQDTKRKELDILDKTKGYEADIKQLKRLQELEKAENDLRVQNIEKKYLGSKENRDLNLIQASKTLYPVEQYIDAYEAVLKNPANFPESPNYVDPNPFLEQAEQLRRSRKAFLQGYGVNIPDESNSALFPENQPRTFENREDLRGYLRGQGLPIPTEDVYQQAPGAKDLNNVANGTKPKSKPKLEY